MYWFVLPGGGRRREEGAGWGGSGGEQIRRHKVPSLSYFLVVISFPGLRLTPRIALCPFSSCQRLEPRQSSRFHVKLETKNEILDNLDEGTVSGVDWTYVRKIVFVPMDAFLSGLVPRIISQS